MPGSSSDPSSFGAVAMARECSGFCRDEIEERASMTSYASSLEREWRESWKSTLSSESVPSLMSSYASSGDPNPIPKYFRQLKTPPKEGIHIGNMAAFPFPKTRVHSTSTWREKLGLGSKASLDGEKTKLYYADPTLAPEYLNIRVEMHRLCCMPHLEGHRGVSERVVRPEVVSPPGERPQREQGRRPGFCRWQGEGVEHIERVVWPLWASQPHPPAQATRATPATRSTLATGSTPTTGSIPDTGPTPATGRMLAMGATPATRLTPTTRSTPATGATLVPPVTTGPPAAPGVPVDPAATATPAVRAGPAEALEAPDKAPSSNGTEGLRNALAEWELYDDVWRPGDEIIPPTDPDYQPIPNFLPKFDPDKETTLSAIRDLRYHTLPRLKRKYESILSLASLKNNSATSSRQSVENNRAHRLRWKRKLIPPRDYVLDIIERRNALTGRRLTVGSTEIRILPTLRKAKLLYYLTKLVDGLQVTINDLGKWSVDAYPEYKDDLVIFRWLIDTHTCKNWSFTVDNIYCHECVLSWKMKRETRIKRSSRKQTCCPRIQCPHRNKTREFFSALGAQHTSRMKNIKLLVGAQNCLNPETLMSAVHTLTTTLPMLQEVEVVFQQDASLLSERILHRRRRRSIVRSLQHLEKWIAPEERLKVTGLDKHPKVLSAWSVAKRSWYYDADRTVRYLWELRQTQTMPKLGRRASSI